MSQKNISQSLWVCLLIEDEYSQRKLFAESLETNYVSFKLLVLRVWGMKHFQPMEMENGLVNLVTRLFSPILHLFPTGWKCCVYKIVYMRWNVYCKCFCVCFLVVCEDVQNRQLVKNSCNRKWESFCMFTHFHIIFPYYNHKYGLFLV